eukprot:CAMPEP_0206211306 /NCGR_PEP_ID=MMETSP0166-20121206/18056_1 /ASSEMBLY_ACC=CAM_ASM_000260 /TAXON_ID=95228 /ORGANISM="Vannella robusta, Strain DIVA3 518/3/11/1/6" /LENGTH=204 /DNA_ID=CAMNT_0053633129 /DNA_START=1047 /DNA_END=1661 /DNA_ORIENTATION=-
MSSAAVLRAANFAALKHVNQRRKVGDIPYINHPIGVANYLTEVGKVEDPIAIQAALLHDTVEDTDTTFEELLEIFGEEVTNVVREVTDNKDLTKTERKKAQVEHAKVCSTAAKLVKLCDKLYNLKDILSNPPTFWSAERCQGYFVWSYNVIEGIRGTNAPLEAALDELFQKSFTMNGTTYPALPKTDLKEFLQGYYKSLDGVDD